MATSSFDKVFIVRKHKDRERLLKILAKADKEPAPPIPKTEKPNFDEAGKRLLECLLRLEN